MINVDRVHIVGIGGIGTSAVAKWYVANGKEVTGSDLVRNQATEELKEMGVQISEQDGSLIDGEVELIVYSPAVPADNPERKKGNELGIRELTYPEWLGQMSKLKKTIAISGTNGKSTTTAMTAKIFIDAGYDPLVFLGTYSPDLQYGNTHNGHGAWSIVEACEYKEGMKNIDPSIAAVTNIEADHLDYYDDVEHIKRVFQEWIEEIHPFSGHVLVNAQNENADSLKHEEKLGVKVLNRRVESGVQSFVAEIETDYGMEKLPLTLQVPGAYNAENAALAAGIARVARIPVESIKDSLAAFSGTWRRGEVVGEFNGAIVVSDYAHHPDAVRGVIEAFKELHGDKNIKVIFEPHQHARTQELFKEFSEAFSGADQAVLLPIYRVAGRTDDEEVTSEKLAAAADIGFAESLELAIENLDLSSDDVLLVLGAGPIDQNLRDYLKV